MDEFYWIIFENGETEYFEKRTEVEEFLKKRFNLSGSQVKEFFRKGSKIPKRFGVKEIVKCTWDTNPCKKYRAPIRSKIIWRTGFTDIEEKMLNGLKGLGFKEDEDFVFQYSVEGKKGNKYVLDFAFPKEKLDIECDGEYWHRNLTRDKERDEFLKSKGWTILRFKSREIKDEKKFQEILRIIKSKVKELKS